MDPPLDIFELWQPAALPTGPGIVFTGNSMPDEVSLWRLNLSANPPQAQQRLTGLERQAHQAEAKLNKVPHRLDQLVQQTSLSRTVGKAFSPTAVTGLGSAGSLPQAETDLLQMIGQIRGSVSFTAGQSAGFDLKAVGDQFRQALNRIFALLTHLAWVETRVEGHLLAQTTVSWTAETRTAWVAHGYPTQRALHQRNLTVALAGRLLLLRTLVVATQGIAKIALLLGATGGLGSVLTLPIAWKYVSQILAEIEQYKKAVEDAAQQTAAVGKS